MARTMTITMTRTKTRSQPNGEDVEDGAEQEEEGGREKREGREGRGARMRKRWSRKMTMGRGERARRTCRLVAILYLLCRLRLCRKQPPQHAHGPWASAP